MNAPDLLTAEPRTAPSARRPGPPNPFYDDLPGVERPTRPGPVPDLSVFQGQVGRTVRELDPTTEADPVGGWSTCSPLPGRCSARTRT